MNTYLFLVTAYDVIGTDIVYRLNAVIKKNDIFGTTALLDTRYKLLEFSATSKRKRKSVFLYKLSNSISRPSRPLVVVMVLAA